MKKEQGITLISLVIYIIGMVIVIGITGTLLSFYNNNMVSMNDSSDVNMELSKLEQQMITETKSAGNQITSVTNTTITFSSGNIYSYADNRIYQNTVPMVNYVKEFMASLEIDGEKQILRLYVVISKGEAELVKNLTYVVEGATTITEVGKPEYVLEYDDTTDVYGNLYKISDTEYHLIFNTTGDIAEGYTEAQLVERGNNIKDGSGYMYNAEGNAISNQPWAKYSENITKVKIEEPIKPRKTTYYFMDLSTITEIEGLDYLDTSNVTDMRSMFLRCSSLTSLDLSGFNTEHVTNIESMFNACNSLTSLDLSAFNTSNVTDMSSMFDRCTSLTSLDVSKWNVENVTDMRYTFAYCSNLTNLDISKWNTRRVTSMREMFTNCSSLTSLDVSECNTENVTSMYALFYGCSKLTNLDLTRWDTANVTDMRAMFNACSSLTSLDLSGFNTGKVKDMSYMFQKCNNLVKIYASDKWSTKAVTAGDKMFNGCTALRGAISYDANKLSYEYANWTTGYFTIRGVYANLYKISDTEYHLIFNTTGATAKGYTEAQLVVNGGNINDGADYIEVSENVFISNQPWISYADNITKVKIEEKMKPRSTAHYFRDLPQITEIEGLEYLDTSNSISMWGMFRNSSKLAKLDVSEWNVENVVHMQGVFYGCSSLKNLDVSKWNTKNVTNMRMMFYGCSGLTSLDVSRWNTENVTDMCSMFNKCTSLASVDLSGFDTKKVTDMSYMFQNCSSLTKIYASDKWTTSAVTNGVYTFSGCTVLKGAISYDANKLSYEYANWTNGYYTYKSEI